jgi:hypothetical protein
MTSRNVRAAVVAATLAALPLLTAACGNFVDGGACTASIEPAVVVEIRDARTGAPLASGASGVVAEGTYADSLRPYEGAGGTTPSLFSRRAADERPGTYAVTVAHPGYQTWTATGVRAGSDACHVRTQRLRAALQPAG